MMGRVADAIAYLKEVAMRFSALSLMRSGEGFNQVRTEDHDVVVRYVVGPQPITVRLLRV